MKNATLTRAQLIMASHAIEGPMKSKRLAPSRGILFGFALSIALWTLIGLGYFVYKVYF